MSYCISLNNKGASRWSHMVKEKTSTRWITKCQEVDLWVCLLISLDMLNFSTTDNVTLTSQSISQDLSTVLVHWTTFYGNLILLTPVHFSSPLIFPPPLPLLSIALSLWPCLPSHRLCHSQLPTAWDLIILSVSGTFSITAPYWFRLDPNFVCLILIELSKQATHRHWGGTNDSVRGTRVSGYQDRGASSRNVREHK